MRTPAGPRAATGSTVGRGRPGAPHGEGTRRVASLSRTLGTRFRHRGSGCCAEPPGAVDGVLRVGIRTCMTGPHRVVRARHGVVVRRRPTLPPRRRGSTIGAERLSFRVRNGTGRFPLAMAAVTR